jgi:hypothetical protein
MSLEQILKEIKEVKPFAEGDAEDGPIETLAGRRGRKVQATERLKQLKRQYIRDLFDVLGRYLEDKANELDISEYPQLIFKDRYTSEIPKYVDHINGDTLNNTRMNLRTSSLKENSRNLTRKVKTNSLGFRGVTKYNDVTRNKPWAARIRVDGKLKHLRFFISAEEAAKTFDEAAKRYFGEFCGKLNFG